MADGEYPSFFVLVLFHPIDKKKWQCNERRILDRYMDIFKKILTNVLHFLSNEREKHIRLRY